MPKIKLLDGSGTHRDQSLSKKPEERAAFVEWLCLPDSQKYPPTLTEVAEQLGVTRKTLYEWRRDPRIVEQVKGRTQGLISVQFLPTLIDALKVQAADPDHPRSVQAAKLLIELMEKAESRVSEVPMADKSNDELREMAAQLYDEFDDRAQTA